MADDQPTDGDEKPKMDTPNVGAEVDDIIDEDGTIKTPEDEGNEPDSSSVDSVDQLLDQLDPHFKEEIADINPKDFKNLEIDKSQTEQNTNVKSGKSLRIQFLKNIPKAKKIRIVAGVLVILFSIPTITMILDRTLLPTFSLPFLLSMKEISTDITTYDPGGSQVPLFDDFRSKAFTLALPRTVIHLKSNKGNKAFGTFEFFLNIRDKELAAIVKTKQTVIIDLIQRTLEQISWEELQSPIGKEKVKKILRFKINEFFQSNIVLGVYYRSILLSK